jgi:hypothetical protein
VLESFRKKADVLGRKKVLNVRWFRWKASQQGDIRLLFENVWNLVARQQNWNLAVGRNDPLRNLALGVWIRSINLVQNQTRSLLISSNEG